MKNRVIFVHDEVDKWVDEAKRKKENKN